MYLEDELGDVIQKFRQGKGLSICDLAGLCGVDAESIERMESYDVLPDEAQIINLAKTLGIRIEGLQALCSGNYPEPADVPFEDFEIVNLIGKRFEANCYLVGRKDASSCVLIDPGVDISRIETALAERSWKIECVLLTHLHSDHIKTLGNLSDKPRTYAGSEEPHFMKLSAVAAVGKVSAVSLDFTIIQTPGHTAGSVSYYMPGALFSGDTLFAGSAGRSEKGQFPELLKSVKQLLTLPETTRVFPGHGSITTVGIEKRFNPFG